MRKKQNKQGEAEPSSERAGSPPADAREELSLLRQQCGSLAMRGHYKECFRLVEDNLSRLYFRERWPENFYNTLKLHRRCYPSMQIDSPYEEYLAALLRKKGIPWVFTLFFKSSDAQPRIKSFDYGDFRAVYAHPYFFARRNITELAHSISADSPDNLRIIRV